MLEDWRYVLEENMWELSEMFRPRRFHSFIELEWKLFWGFVCLCLVCVLFVALFCCLVWFLRFHSTLSHYCGGCCNMWCRLDCSFQQFLDCHDRDMSAAWDQKNSVEDLLFAIMAPSGSRQAAVRLLSFVLRQHRWMMQRKKHWSRNFDEASAIVASSPGIALWH